MKILTKKRTLKMVKELDKTLRAFEPLKNYSQTWRLQLFSDIKKIINRGGKNK